MDAPGRVPPQLRTLVASATCERFSFYGMASILAVYLNEHLLYSERDAKVAYHAFLAATYLMPLAGAWLANRFVGRYRAIVVLSLANLLGLAVLAAWESRVGLAVGLALVAAGAGGMKPCVSAFVGDRLRASDAAARRRGQGGLSWAANAGAAAATLAVPAILLLSGPRAAFALATLLAAASLLTFRSLRGYAVEAPPGPNPHGFLRVLGRALARLGTGHPGQHWLELARDAHPAEAVEGARSVLRIAGLFAAVTLFWALFDQRGSSWVFQARQMDLTIAGRQLSPAQLQALNPLLVLALAPILRWLVFPLLERRGLAPPPLRKMTAGMFLTVLSFAAAAIVQMLVDSGRAPHALWQLPQHVFLAAGEVLVTLTGLELASTRAPPAMRSTILSVWFLTVSLGNLLTALATGLLRLEGAGQFWLFAGLMLAAALAFQATARGWRKEPAQVIVGE